VAPITCAEQHAHNTPYTTNLCCECGDVVQGLAAGAAGDQGGGAQPPCFYEGAPGQAPLGLAGDPPLADGPGDLPIDGKAQS
jgi:hypothetical protein